MNERQQSESARQRQKDAELEEIANQAQNFKDYIQEYKYHEDMLRKEFPNKMQEKFNLTGVYIAVYD